MTHPKIRPYALAWATATLLTLTCFSFAAPASAANRAPSISGSPPLNARPGQLYSFRPSASDPDGNRLTFHILNRPAWANFDRNTGRLWGTPTTKNIGRFASIHISVGDGMGMSVGLAPFAITVGTSSQSNTPPLISGSPPLTARVGQAYYFRPTASDPQGSTLTFSIVNRPAWVSFDTSNGTLSGTPGSGAVGNYPNITIRVTDGQVTSQLSPFTIAVTAATSGSTGSASLAWTPPTRRTNGTLLTNLAGYRIRYGMSSGNYPNVIEIRNSGARSAVVSNLPAGSTYYFVVCAFDALGLVSQNTPPVSKHIP